MVFFILWLYQYLLARIPAEDFSIYPVLLTLMTLIPIIVSFFGSALSRSIVAAYTAGSFAVTTFMMKNALMDNMSAKKHSGWLHFWPWRWVFLGV